MRPNICLQLETAAEMRLTKEDVAKLYKRWPLRYKELAVAFGIDVKNETKGSKQ